MALNFAPSTMYQMFGTKPAYNAPATTDWNNPTAGLGQDVLSQLKNGQPYILPGGHYDPMGKSYGVITGGTMPGTGNGATYFNSTENGPDQISQNPAQVGYSYIPLNGQQTGANDYWFNSDGSHSSTYQNDHIMGYAKGIGTVVGSALGMGAIGAGAAGAAGGDAMSAMYSGDALGGGASINGGSALGSIAPSTGALGATTAGSQAAFNPAVDSQLASSQLGITGNQAALSAAEGAIPSVTVNGAANGGFLDSLLGAGSSLNSIPGGSSLLKTALTSLLGQGGGTGGSNVANSNTGLLGGMGLNDLAGILGNAYGANQLGNSSQAMQQWLQGQQAKIDNLYSPGSPEYNTLFDQMSRQDAAAGRNSQYGPRSVDLAGKIAQTKADATTRFTGLTAGAYSNALNQNANKNVGLLSAIQHALQNGGNRNLSSILSGLTGDNNSVASGSGSADPAFNLDQYINSGQVQMPTDDYYNNPVNPTEQDVMDLIKTWGF